MEKILDLTERLSFCPLCDAQNFIQTHAPDLCKCNICNVFFRNPRPSHNSILRSYNTGSTFSQWQNELDIRAKLWKKRLSMISDYKSSGSLLDIGTGDGYFLDFAKMVFDVEATEISKTGVRFSRDRGHSVHHGTIFDAKFDSNQYDIITMWHVLEHMGNPGATLKRIKTLLRLNGILIIAVPNETNRLHPIHTALKNEHPFSPHTQGEEIHLIHFTPKTLTRALSNVFGFNILRLDVDDVHVHKRFLNSPRYYINRIVSRLFGWHWDTAMVVICTPEI
ncbi:MAG: class I SAM-dependent methyltransferase [Pseudomonadota bacterium]